MNEYNQSQQDFNQPQVALPNATAVLILGILGILGCCCWGGGAILSIIALVLAAKDVKLYKTNPFMYTQSSHKNLNAGRVCAIIGLVFSIIGLLWILYVMNDPAFKEAMDEAMKNYQ